MKPTLLLLVLVGLLALSLNVSASTNCSTGCDVSGATFFDSNIVFLNWNNPANDASIRIKDSNGSTVAIKSTTDVVNWGTSQLMRFFPQKDGNYTLEVVSNGVDSNYHLKLDFNSLGTLSTFQDTNCVGSGCGGGTKTYKFNVSNSPPLILDDNRTFSTSVKGGTIFVATVKIFNGGDCTFIPPTPQCDASIAIRRTSDNNIVAFKSTSSWTDTPFVLDWLADKDANYSVDVFYQGGVANYDFNVVYIDNNGSQVTLVDNYNFIGSSLTTGTVTNYFFRVINSPTLAFNDGQTTTPNVKGGTLVKIRAKYYDGHTCTSIPPTPECDTSIAVRRISDNNVVAFRNSSSWSDGPFDINWFADRDDQYAIEVYYQGTWGQFDLNMSYTGIDGNAYNYSDTYSYIGSGLAVGTVSKYFFSVAQSPVILLDDDLTAIYAANKGSALHARVRFRTGYDCTFIPPNPGCDAAIRIRNLDNNILAQTTTASWTTWSTSPVDLNWTVANPGTYFIEVYYEGVWGQYDLNVDYTDTTNVNRHLEDNYQYIGSGINVGNFTQYYLKSSGSCGNGINCAATACVPVILNGDPSQKIDLAFIGSGFPSQEKLKDAIEFVTNYDGDEDGLFSFEPFKSNRGKFNIWQVNKNETYDAFSQPLNGGLVTFGYNPMFDATGACPFADEFSVLSITPRIWAHALTEESLLGPTGKGAHWNFMTMGCEFLGDCNYPLDLNAYKVNDPNCNGDGNDSFCEYAADYPEEHQRLFAHEFGHSFGGLLDERITTSGSGGSTHDAPNCTNDSTCFDWNSTFTGVVCDPGCKYSNWYKPFYTSLMDSHENPRAEFLAINENELQRDIELYPTEQGAPNSFLTYLLNIQFGATLTVNQFDLANGSYYNVIDSNGGHIARILDANGQKLYDFNFVVANTIEFEDYGTQTIADANMNIRLPYFPTAKTIVILDASGTTLLNYDIFKPTNIEYALGSGGGVISSSNYRVKYSILQQPVGIINSSSYICELGVSFLHE